MISNHLHVVSFNVPFPPDYGGVIDVYYRIKALHERGIKIHLHCFDYGRGKSKDLEKVCEEVIYYTRNKSLKNQFSRFPFIVKSRNNAALIKNLVKDGYPIVFEGIHSCYYLNDERLKNRLKIVRSHNIEHHYYKELSRRAETWPEKIYFSLESVKLRRFEKTYSHAAYIAAISASDQAYFQQKYGNSFLMLPCHSNEEVTCKEGKGDYVLYHADLSIRENEEASLFVTEKIAPKVKSDFIIAGKNPSSRLEEKVGLQKNVILVKDPSFEKMQDLIANAHINLLPAFQSAGFKLKLINALFSGRFCLGTPELTEGTGLEESCTTAHSPEQFINHITALQQVEFTGEMVNERKRLLKKYTNHAAVSKMAEIITAGTK